MKTTDAKQPYENKELSDVELKEISRDSAQGLKLIRKMKSCAIQYLKEHSEVDEQWNLDPEDQDEVEVMILEDDDFYSKFREVLSEYWDELVDIATHEKRQELSEARQAEKSF